MILLNIGSNLDSIKGDRFFNLKKTLELIKSEKIEIIKKSSTYETPSYPNKKNPKFLNIGLIIKCNFSHEMLIKNLEDHYEGDGLLDHGNLDKNSIIRYEIDNTRREINKI